MKIKLGGGRISAGFTFAALLLSAFPVTFVRADDTGYISPQPQNGFYAEWADSSLSNTNTGTFVNDYIGCNAADATYWAAQAINTRQSVIIAIPGSIPDGSTIDSVDVQVCQTLFGLNNTPPLPTFQTFIRVDGANTDSGVDISAAAPNTNKTVNTQNIPVGVVMTGGTIVSLEAGVLKTDTLFAQRIYSLAASINYTLPGSSTTVVCNTPLIVDTSTLCTATVAPSAGNNIASGNINWTSADGTFSSPSCVLTGGQCSVNFTRTAVGVTAVMAAYPGDANMSGSDGVFPLEVIPPVPVPVFGPLGLVFTVLGMGLIGGWRTRRKS